MSRTSVHLAFAGAMFVVGLLSGEENAALIRPSVSSVLS
jgi:hypothetical protein